MSLRRTSTLLVCSCLLAGFGTSVLATEYAAKVGKDIISQRDVENVLKNNPSLADTEQNRRAITEELVAHELIIQAAKQKRLDSDPRVRAAIADSTRQILFTAGVESYLREHPIEDSAVREQYDNFIKNYPKEEYKVRHIVVKTKEEADQIVEQIRDGKSFDDLATQSLETETAKKGGDMGWIAPLGSKDLDLLSNLKVGQVSEPVEVTGGWNIVQVTDKRPAHPPEFDKVKERFRGLMQQEVVRHYVQELREKTTVVIP